MAFSTAGGYGNLPNGNFSSVIYSKKVQLAFRKSTVCGDITNSDYFGEIAAQGDTVKIIKEPEISVYSDTHKYLPNVITWSSHLHYGPEEGSQTIHKQWICLMRAHHPICHIERVPNI